MYAAMIGEFNQYRRNLKFVTVSSGRISTIR
jgi:hypothetical protein